MSNATPTIQRWRGPAPSEDALWQIFRSEGLQPYAWSNAPHDVYRAHAHRYVKVVRVARGAIRFDLPHNGQTVHLGPGDTLIVPAGVVHSAVVGPEGVTCLEAPQRERPTRRWRE